MKRRKLETFAEFERKKASGDKSRVEHYKAPKYVVQPAKGDKGFALLKGMLKNIKQTIRPGLFV